MDFAVILIIVAAVVFAVAMFHNRMQKRRLQRALKRRDMSTLIDMGWEVQVDTAEHTYLVRGRRVNHILHLLLSVVTAGIWVPVWVWLALNGGEQRATLPK